MKQTELYEKSKFFHIVKLNFSSRRLHFSSNQIKQLATRITIIIVATTSQIPCQKRWPNFNNKEIQGDYQQTLPQ
jgi:hypothetical protein